MSSLLLNRAYGIVFMHSWGRLNHKLKCNMCSIGILIEENCHYSRVVNELTLPHVGGDLKVGMFSLPSKHQAAVVRGGCQSVQPQQLHCVLRRGDVGTDRYGSLPVWNLKLAETEKLHIYRSLITGILFVVLLFAFVSNRTTNASDFFSIWTNNGNSSLPR